METLRLDPPLALPDAQVKQHIFLSFFLICIDFFLLLSMVPRLVL